MKQTAVEWLANNLKQNHGIDLTFAAESYDTDGFHDNVQIMRELPYQVVKAENIF